MRVLVPWYRYPPWTGDATGGLSVAMWELTHHLADLGITIEVLVPPGAVGAAEPIGNRLSVLSGEMGRRLQAAVRLSPAERASLDAYDAILSIHNFAAFSLASAGLVDRVVRQVHTVLVAQPLEFGLSLQRGPLERVLTFFSKRRYEAQERRLRGCRTVCVSAHLRDEMLAHGLEDRRNLWHVPLGVDTDAFRPRTGSKEYDILFVGKFVWVKGLDLLLRSVAQMDGSRRIPTVAVVGPYTTEQRRYVEHILPPGKRGTLRFLGSVPHDSMPETINAARCVALPSRYETFSLTALESMACGVPVVGFRVGALPELVAQPGGALVEPEDTVQFGAALRAALEEPAVEAAAREHGPRRAERFRWEALTRQFAGILRGEASPAG